MGEPATDFSVSCRSWYTSNSEVMSLSMYFSSPQKIQVNGLPGNSRVHLAPIHCLVPRLCRTDFSLSVLRVSWSLQSPAFLWEMARKGKETYLRAYRHSSHLPTFNGSHKDNLSHCHFLQLHRSFKYNFMTLPSPFWYFCFHLVNCLPTKSHFLPPPS